MKKELFFRTADLLSIKELDNGPIYKNELTQYFFYLDTYLTIAEEFFVSFDLDSIANKTDLFIEGLNKQIYALKKLNLEKLMEQTENLIKLIENKEFEKSKEEYKKLAIDNEELYSKINNANISKGIDGEVIKYNETIRKNSVFYKKVQKYKTLPLETLDKGKVEEMLKLVNDFQLLEAGHVLSTVMQKKYGEKIDYLLIELKHNFDNFEAAAAQKTLTKIAFASADKNAVATEKKSILAIDDNVGVLNTLKAMLKDYYELFCIPNPNAVFKFLENRESLDMILLDIEMPEMDGYELLTLIKKYTKYEKIPVIFLTGNATKDHLLKAVEMSAVDFISKPVDLETLLSKIKKHI